MLATAKATTRIAARGEVVADARRVTCRRRASASGSLRETDMPRMIGPVTTYNQVECSWNWFGISEWTWGSAMEERLLTFLTVAQFSSFQNAADALGVAPSTVTDRVKRLEEDLGCSLFRRLARSVHVTEAGREFLTHAQRTLAALEAGRQAVDALRSLTTDHVRVACAAVPAYGALPTILSTWRSKGEQPLTHCTLITTTSKRAFRLVLQDEVDIAIVNINFRHPDLETELLDESEFVLVGTPGLGRQTRLEADRGRGGSQLLFFREELEDTLRVRRVFAALALSDTRVVAISDLGVLEALLLEGCGVGLVPARIAERFVADGRLTRQSLPAAVHLPRQVTCCIRRRGLEAASRYDAVSRFEIAVRSHYRRSHTVEGQAKS